MRWSLLPFEVKGVFPLNFVVIDYRCMNYYFKGNATIKCKSNVYMAAVAVNRDDETKGKSSHLSLMLLYNMANNQIRMTIYLDGLLKNYEGHEQLVY